MFDADGEIKASVTMMCPFGTGNTAGYVDPVIVFGGSDVIEYQWDEFCNAKGSKILTSLRRTGSTEADVSP